MSNAIGYLPISSGATSSALNSGATVYDVTKYGAVSGVAGSLNTALSNIIAAAGNAYGRVMEIYAPGGVYPLTDSLWLPSTNCSLVGEDKITTIIQGGTLPAVIAGMPSELGAQNLTAGHWPSIASVMDGSWGGAGQYGFAMYDPATGLTNPDLRYMYFQGTTLTQGLTNDHWTETNKFTLEFAIKCQIASPTAGAASLGPGVPPLGFGCWMPNYTTTTSVRPWSVGFQGVQGDVTSGTSTSLTFNQNFSVNSIYGGSIPIGSLVSITTGPGAGQLNQVTSVTYNGGSSITLGLANAWSPTLPTTASTIMVIAGINLSINVATTLLHDGQSPGYDPSVDGTTYTLGLLFPAGVTLSAQSAGGYSLFRFKIQVDLTATTYANLTQGWVSTSGSALADFLPMTQDKSGSLFWPTLPLPNPYFVEASFATFVLGAQILSPQYLFAMGYGSIPFSYPGKNNGSTFTADQTTALPAWDVAICGFSLMAGNAGGNVYSVGSTPALNPSGPRPTGTVNDSFAYDLYNVAGLLGYLPLNDPGLTDIQGGALVGLNGTNRTYTRGFVLPLVYASTQPLGSNIEVRNLTITGSFNPAAGVGLLIGPCYSVVVKDVATWAFQNGIAQVSFNDGYIDEFNDISTRYSADAGLFLWNTYARFQNLTTGYSRTGLRLIGTTLEGDMYFAASPGNGLHLIRCHYGGIGNSHSLILRYFLPDNESPYPGSGPTIAMIDIDNSSNNVPSNVSIEDANLSSAIYGSAYINLRQIQSGGTSTFKIKHPSMSGYGMPLIRLIGGNTGWAGTIEDINFNQPSPDFDNTPVMEATFGARTTRIKYDQSLPALPDRGPWMAGLTTIHILAEGLLPGMPTRFVCVTSGQYGTATPPVWDGRDIYAPDGTNNAMWAATFREDWASCTLSGV